MTPPVVLAIAATDPSGGAGLAADLATFAALGVHGACVVTAVTVQDTTAVHAVHPVPTAIVAAQLDAVLEDLRPTVVKIGMVGSPETVVCLSHRIPAVSGTRPLSVVVDPVLRATTGARLADAAVVDAYREHLLPLATVVTPNADEDAALGRPRYGAVLVTGSGTAPDRLIRPGRPDLEIPHEAVCGTEGTHGIHSPGPVTNDHGTGCTHASALASYLALGLDLPTAATGAAAYVRRQLRTGADWDLGRGRGPIAHIHTPAAAHDPRTVPTRAIPTPALPTAPSRAIHAPAIHREDTP